MHNLTYQERARFAYAAGNTELGEALEQLAEFEITNEELTDKVWELENNADEDRIEELEDQVSELENNADEDRSSVNH